MQEPSTEPPRQNLRVVGSQRRRLALGFDPWRVTVGLSLVALGTVFLLDQAGYIRADRIIGAWWPLPLVLLGVLSWVAYPRAPLGPAVVTLIGLGLLLGGLGIVPGGLGTLWPLILVAVGGWILVGRVRPAGPRVNQEDAIDRFAAFSGLEVASQSRSFSGGTLTALFGGINLDLRDAQLPPEGATLDAFAAFGGIQIRIPTGWRVDLTGLPLFGGLDDKTVHDASLPEDAPTLGVRATAIFGGVEVRH